VNGPLPDPRSLGDGIHLIPAPLPFPTPAWVNCYAIETDHGLVLIDCGCDWEPGHAALEAGLAAVGLAGADIHTLIVSHLHPDHVGMAGRVVEEHGCRFVMHRRAAARMDRYNDTLGFVERNRRLAEQHGAPPPVAAALAGSKERPFFMPPLQPPDVTVDEGDRIDLGGGRYLEVLHTPGHEPAHICLRDSRTGVLFSGDHVLPRISPVIMYDEEYEDVLGDYLQSLRRLLEMRIGLTYPAHGTIIERGSARVEQIVLHHERRLNQMLQRAQDSPVTAWDVVGAVFRPHLTPDEQRLALLETISHLEHLRLGERVHREERNGVLWYRY
jgi:glyoxylase-like metal-dependent hydrolase (beta-lactamase superfamily II)